MHTEFSSPFFKVFFKLCITLDSSLPHLYSILLNTKHSQLRSSSAAYKGPIQMPSGHDGKTWLFTAATNPRSIQIEPFIAIVQAIDVSLKRISLMHAFLSSIEPCMKKYKSLIEVLPRKNFGITLFFHCTENTETDHYNVA